MALATPTSIADRVKLRTGISDTLSRDMVTNAFRDLFDRRLWSWLVKPGQFIVPSMYQVGTASVATNSAYITGTGTNWTQTFVGQQIRFGVGAPIYDIVQVLSPTLLVINLPYADIARVNAGYFIYQAYYVVPQDFHSFITLVDTRYNFQLMTDVGQDILNLIDAQRANFSMQSYVASFRDYSTSNAGTIQPPIIVSGANLPPAISPQATYTAPSNSSFIIAISTGGVVGGALQFTWQKIPIGGSPSAISLPQTPDPNNPSFLQDGVAIFFDPTITYATGNTFVITCVAQANSGLPRYELWPHNTSAYQYQFLYESRPGDVFDPGFVLPRYIAQRADVLFEGAMANAARWPGTSSEPNVYYDLALALQHDKRYEWGISDLMRQDENVNMIDMRYQTWQNWPWSPLFDSNWLATHAL